MVGWKTITRATQSCLAAGSWGSGDSAPTLGFHYVTRKILALARAPVKVSRDAHLG
jgi:hypothetical protein